MTGLGELPNEVANSRSRKNAVVKMVIAVVIVVCVSVYTAGVVVGRIDQNNKIDGSNLALLALAACVVIVLIRPDVVDRLRLFQVAGVRLEMQQVKDRQASQENALRDISLILPLLLPPVERRHLKDLAEKRSVLGSHELRTALRHLRSMELIRMRGGHHVADLKDGLALDLGEYIELTDLGERWVTRIREIDEAEAG